MSEHRKFEDWDLTEEEEARAAFLAFLSSFPEDLREAMPLGKLTMTVEFQDSYPAKITKTHCIDFGAVNVYGDPD